MDSLRYLRSSSVTAETIQNEIAKIGVVLGDTLFITGDLLAVGFFNQDRDRTYKEWMSILRACVGPTGTVNVAGYTDSVFRFKQNKDVTFHRMAVPNSGALSMAFLLDEGTIRSDHPTHSYFGFGPNAARILRDHNRHSLCYSVIGEIVKLGGKNLMLGTIDKKNAPMAYHYAQ